MTASTTDQLGAALRRARRARGLTQAEVAEQVGLAVEAYGRLERGSSLPRADTLARLSTALRVSADELLGLGAPRALAEPSGPYRASRAPERRLQERIARAPPRVVALLSRLLGELEEVARPPPRPEPRGRRLRGRRP